ncbi:MAG: helix-hairpin-helix domain-containing protein [Proteobacteria bacterium]|nr:helix-hairpin-helix domain-containing protein [Pseudomonadota bacterium]MBU4356962.1 helix-hairpin-helix domain-containing protein [Pseudomonadota bacterium]
MPYFSRSQLGVVLLLGAALLGLYAWRAHVLFPPAPPPPGTMSLAFVEVAGKVAHPGVYSFPRPPSLREVWAKAGVVGTPSDPDKTIASGSRVEVTPEGGFRVAAMSGAQLLTLGLSIDLNRATAEDLAAVPGLGPALAQRIVDYRKAHGPFKKIEDLREVSGVGPQNLQKLKPYLGLGSPEAIAPPDWGASMTNGKSVAGTYLESQEGRLPGSKSDIGPKTPGRVIDSNRSSKADLETLPGIGPALAQRIIDYRRAHGPYKKIADLRKVSGIGRKKLEKLRPYVAITSQGPPASGH